MGQSSISQQRLHRLSQDLAPRWRRALGDELRRRRAEQGLTQSAVGYPLSRAFVSAVERGRAVPSLPALRHLLQRLDTPLSEFFAGVEKSLVDQNLTTAYDPDHGDRHHPKTPPRRRRSA